MTAMPDVMAKTRICTGLEERFLPAHASDDDLGKWLKLLEEEQGYMAADLIRDLQLHRHGWKNTGGVDDEDHIKKHVFGIGADPWWEAEAHEIATEAFARGIWLMTHDIDGNGVPRRAVDFWWECPATIAFRIFLLQGERITVIISTPPKPDHAEHYAEYRSRLQDQRNLPKAWAGGPLTQLEPLLIVSATARSVPEPISKIHAPLTGAKVPNVVTAQPKCD